VITGWILRGGRRTECSFDVDDIHEMLRQTDGLVWIDAMDPTDDELEHLAKAFQLHPVTLEDTQHRQQRPKIELFASYAFATLRALSVSDDDSVRERELHAFVGPRFIVTLRFGPDPFDIDHVLTRWERQPELLSGGFAAYVLIDEVVDDYLSIVERFEDLADDLEDEVFQEGGDDGGTRLQERIFRLKREVVRLRRVVVPLRQGLDLLQEEPRLAEGPLLPYFRDVTEHTLRVAELADNIRDLLTSLLEVRVGQISNHMNDIMKKQAAWAGIILVPTLIAGIYGMNFLHMPELSWRLGYPMALAMMALSAGALYVVFKRKEWL
jgi:magnesium transporter